MRFSKVFVLLLILVLSAGIVSAMNVGDLKVPSNFQYDGNESFNEMNGLGLVDENGIALDVFSDDDMKFSKEVMESDDNDSDDSDVNESDFDSDDSDVNESDSDLDDNDTDMDLAGYFKNDTVVNYTVESIGEENIFLFNDDVNEVKGYIELVKIGDDEYVIQSSVGVDASDDKLKQSLDALKEFNKLNDFNLTNPILED